MPDPNSIWHKEISFRRKPRDKAPEPEATREDAEPEVTQEDAKPVRRRRLLARRAATGAPAAAEPAVPVAPEPEPEPGAADTLVVPAPRATFGRASAAPPPVQVSVPAAPPPPPLPVPEIAAEPAGPVAADEPPPEPPAPAEKTRKKRQPRQRVEPGQRRYKSLVGLKVGAYGIAAAHVLNGHVPRVIAAAHGSLEPGLVVGGEARRPDELATALKLFFKKHRLPRGPVRLGIANNRIGVRVIELAGIEDPKQLGNAVRFRAQEVLPIPLEEAAIDYRVLREDAGEDGKPVHRVLLVVAHRQLVDGYASACRRAGLKLVGIDLETFGLLRALTPANAKLGAASDSALVVASIGHDLSTIAVSDGKACEFTRVLEWGATALDSAIVRALQIAPEHAEPIRVAVGLADWQEPPDWMAPDDAEKARAAMRAELQTFGRDVVSSLRFYQEQPDSLGIAEIVVTGGCAQMTGMAAELTSLLGVNVRVGDPLTRAIPGRKLAKESPSASLTAAIGLGIED
jgi:type IV pilus assembly protein PilM